MSAGKILASAPLATDAPRQVYANLNDTSETPEAHHDPRSTEETVHAPVWSNVRAIVEGAPPPATDASNGQEPLQHDAVFDVAKFREYVGDDEALLLKVVRRFLSDTHERLDAIDAAANSGDASNVARLAHSLKGSVGFFAAAPAFAAALKLEMRAKTGEWRELPSLCAVLRREIIRLTLALETFVTSTLSPTPS